MEASITQLVFEHTLRIRVNSHTSKEKDKDKEGSSSGSVKGKSRNVSGTATPATVVGDSSTLEAPAPVVVSGMGEMGDAADLAHQEASGAAVILADGAGGSTGGSTTVGASASTGDKDKAKEGEKEKDGEKKEKLKVEDQSGKILTVITNDLTQLQWGVYFVGPRAFFLPFFHLISTHIDTQQSSPSLELQSAPSSCTES
jgi:hypothetical protein